MSFGQELVEEALQNELKEILKDFIEPEDFVKYSCSKDQVFDYIRCIKRLVVEANALIAKVNKLTEQRENAAELTVHYRNLAIVLGAKPEQMLGQYDRKLCESGINPDDTSNGYYLSINEELDNLKLLWQENEELREELDKLKK